ncbi:MAG: EAL domain-containing protein [Gammaproteobacteria bacterium]|nr:EAL domain-containing protein [Gammaproteobacteria bacterium]
MPFSSTTQKTTAKKTENNLPYIEPTIRLIAGFLLTTIGIMLYLHNDMLLLLLGFLFFISLNLFQSAITHWCLMEKILKFSGFRSELDVIKELSAEALHSTAIQKSHIDTLNLLNEAVLELSEDGIILSASDGWCRLLGKNLENCQTLGKPITDFIEANDKILIVDMLRKVNNSQQKVNNVRFRLIGKDQSEHWIGGKFMLQQLNDELKIRGVLRDITDAYLQEKQIKHMAMHDSLTGLPNRVMLENRMTHAMAQSKRHKKIMGLLFIDLDNFKQINDIHGHKTGDSLLITISKIMKNRLRVTDTLSRWGGDEFVVLLPELNNETDLRNISRILMDKLEDELFAEGFDTVVTLSIGGAIYPNDADTSEGLLMQADKALYFAKDQGRNNVQLYSELVNNGLGFYDLDMTSRFTQAVKDKIIEPYYQVIVSSKDHKLTGYETLARWHDEKHGWVSPAIFIPLAENLGLIQDLGRQILEKALLDFSSVANANPDLVLSVNLSNRQLMQVDFNIWLSQLVTKHQIKPNQLKLEITESLAQIGIVRAKELLYSLRNLGFSLSLDDFGTGYSSLSHLHNLPVDELKIDMSFVKRFKDKDGHTMLETISAMGHSLGLELVAEGVETVECVEAMHKLGIDRLQGYYFGKPESWDKAVKSISTSFRQAQ